MGNVFIQDYTTKEPITLIGIEAGVCWGADTSNKEKNFKRGLNCLAANHGRTFEFPDIYMVIDGYSARVIREFYTHIGGAPTRLQESTRYLNYKETKGIPVVTPLSIFKNTDAAKLYFSMSDKIQEAYIKLIDEYNIPKEDAAMLLPLGMKTKIVCKMNYRTLWDMAHQRLCSRAYLEFRVLMEDIKMALGCYSNEWAILANRLKSKCEEYGYCTEEKSCGRYPKKEEVLASQD